MCGLDSYLSGDAVKPIRTSRRFQPRPGSILRTRATFTPIPIHRPAVYTVLYFNSTIYNAEIGRGVVPKDAADFRKVLEQLNRPQRRTIRLRAQVASNACRGTSPTSRGSSARRTTGGWTRAANWSRLRNGAIQSRCRVCPGPVSAAGLYHPDPVTFNSPIQLETAFLGNKAVFAPHNMAFYNSLWRRGSQATLAEWCRG